MLISWKPLALTLTLALVACDHANAQNGFRRNRSQNTTVAQYSVTNSGSVDVAVFWVQPNGEERLYKTLRPGENYLQESFRNHEWVIRRVDTGAELSREKLNSPIQGRNVRPVAVLPNPNPTPAPGPVPNPSPNPGPNPGPNPNPGPQPAPKPADVLKAESVKAIDYLNQIRANPGAFTHLSRSLGDADVSARPALKPNAALQAAADRKAQWMAQTGQFEHVMTINGQKVGMNQWMREAGYPLAAYLPNNETNFECLYMDGGFGAKDIGKRVMDAFMSEGKDGGHVLPTLGRGWWTPCKDVAVGMAKSSDGSIYVCVLVGIYDPFNPEKTGP